MTRKQRPGLVGPLSPKGRRVFTIVWRRTLKDAIYPSCWVCKERGTYVCIYQRIGEDKRAFIERCASLVSSYPLSQLIVKTKAGRVSFERTYGEDPRRTRG